MHNTRAYYCSPWQDAARRLAIVLPPIMNTSCWPRHHHSHSRTRQLRNSARRARTRSLPAVAIQVHNPLARSHMWRRNRSHRRTEAQPSLLTTVYEMVYGLRPRKPVRRDPLLCQVYDALPTDVLRHIMLMRIAMPHQYNLRSRRRGITATQAATAPAGHDEHGSHAHRRRHQTRDVHGTARPPPQGSACVCLGAVWPVATAAGALTAALSAESVGTGSLWVTRRRGPVDLTANRRRGEPRDRPVTVGIFRLSFFTYMYCRLRLYRLPYMAAAARSPQRPPRWPMGSRVFFEHTKVPLS